MKSLVLLIVLGFAVGASAQCSKCFGCAYYILCVYNVQAVTVCLLQCILFFPNVSLSSHS